MKTSDPKEQFLTAMKNCKFGVFRAQTDIQKVIEIFGQSEAIERPKANGQDQIVYLDGFEIIFDGISFNSLVSVKANFRGEDTLLLNYKLADLMWLDWISKQSLNVIKNLLLFNLVKFRFLVYTDDSIGLMSTKGSSSMLILFNDKGKINSIYNLFDNFNSYNILKELKSYNI